MSNIFNSSLGYVCPPIKIIQKTSISNHIVNLVGIKIGLSLKVITIICLFL